jgi:hypothetical protein
VPRTYGLIMALTYLTLAEAIKQYTENTETTFSNNIPNFIIDAETIINNTVQLPAFRKNVTGETTQDFPYLNIPDDFLSVFSMAVMDINAPLVTNNYRYLLNKDVNYIREAFPFPGVTGTPQYYGLFSDTSFILGPTPDQCYHIELHYFAYPPSITVAGTSWVGNNFPNVLLYGSLVNAYIYMKGEPELIQTYQSKFQEGLEALKQLADSKDREDAYRTTQVRYPTK